MAKKPKSVIFLREKIGLLLLYFMKNKQKKRILKLISFKKKKMLSL